MSDLFSLHGFCDSLLQIIGINIILSGDNAVVVAMAARSLPHSQQRKAVVCGSVLAILMRVILSFFAIRLLEFDWVKVVGSVLLLWIGIRLLQPEKHQAGGTAATNLLEAVRIIVLADTVMSLDNVIAVAGAAKGNLYLLIIGLAISIPIIIFGASALIVVMNRFPIIITVGAGLLGWVAGDMAMADPGIRDHARLLHQLPEFIPSAVGAIFVILLGSYLAARASSSEPPTVKAGGISFQRES